MSEQDGLLDRLFASVYDRAMGRVESALGVWRADLLADLQGDVLEIGAGTGANLPYYRQDVKLTLLEPSPSMRRYLEKHLAERGEHGKHRVVAGSAEALPFDEGSFDAVVAGLVLCSVADPAQSLAEIRRVLKPDGKLVFIEHVVSRRRWVRALHTAIEPVWKVIGRGCHLTRDTEASLERAGFRFERIVREPLPRAGLPAIRGVARVA